MIKLTTTQTVTINDLGKRTFTHPITDYILTDEFTPETIRDSVDIQSAVTYGSIILTDFTGNTITDVANQPVFVIDVDGTLNNNSDLIVSSQKAIKTYSDTKVPNTRKVNSKTLSSDIILDTSDISGTTDRRYVTDANLVVLGNTSGTNSGNETVNTIGTLINGATAKTTPVDTDMVGLMDSAATNVLKKLSWLNIKATLKTYFDTLYNSPIFGQSFYVSTNNTTVTNNSTSGYGADSLTVVVHSYTLTATTSGVYRIGAKFNYTVNSTTVSSKFRWYLNNVALGSIFELEVNDTTNRLTYTDFFYSSLNVGSNHTLELRVASENASTTQTIYSSSVEFWRIS